MEPLRVALIDDEPLARMRLKALLNGLALPNRIVGEYGEPVTALMALKDRDLGEDAADVLLLDIQMPGLDGMVLAARLRDMARPPAVVFVTAHPEHALRAFELSAVDYLTKPVRAERLETALSKARDWCAARVMRGSGREAVAEAEVFVVRSRDRLERIPLADILYFKAEQKVVSLHTAERSLTLDESLAELEQRVGERFVRVHRNALVSRQAMRALERRPDEEEGGEGWAVLVAPTQVWLQVSRRQAGAVREAMAAVAG